MMLVPIETKVQVRATTLDGGALMLMIEKAVEARNMSTKNRHTPEAEDDTV